MAIQRDYSGVDFRAQDTRTIYQGQINQVQFQPDREITVGEKSDWVGKLIGDLGGKVANQLNDLGQQHLQDRYLEGAAKVGQIESEEEIQGNPITRDWEVAGYRDAHNRVLMADAEAQIAADMPKLREKSPAEMTQYLAELRGKLTPHLASGSREQRVANFAKLLTNTQAAQKKHAAEHQAYVQEVESKSLYASITTAANIHADLRLKAAVDGKYKPAYEASLTNLGMRLATDIFENPKLDAENAESLAMEIIERQLDTGGGDVYEFLNNLPILDSATGKASTILSRLSVKNQNKLSAKFTGFREKYNAQIHDEYLAGLSALEASLDAPGGSKLTYDELNAELDKGLVLRAIDGGRVDTVRKKFLKSSAQRRDIDAVAIAVKQGNWRMLRDLGKSDSEALDALDAVHARDGLPIKSRFGEYLGAATAGISQAYTRLGTMLGPAFIQLLNPDSPISEDNQQMLSAMDAALAKMNLAEESFFKQGMSEDQRRVVTRLRAIMRDTGLGTKEAAAQVSREHAEDAKLGPAAVTARAEAFAKADQAELDAYSTQGLITGILKKYMPNPDTPFVPGFLEVGVAGSKVLMPKSGFFEANDAVVREQVARVRSELNLEMSHLRESDRHSDSRSLITSAGANVAARAIPTKYNPIILPRGTTPDSFFHIPADQFTIGKIIDGMLPPPKFGGRYTLEADMSTGSVVVTEWNQKDGSAKTTNNVFRILPDQVKNEYNRLNTVKINRENELVGDGRKLSSTTGSVKFNGDNYAGVRHDWMFDFRNSLVANEGIRNTKYTLKGKDVIGVGIHSEKYWPKVGEDGKASTEAISESFAIASSDAAKAGRFIQDREGLFSKEAFLLFAEMAYHGGASGNFGWYMHRDKEVRAQYHDFVTSLKSGDVTKAKELFLATAVGRDAGSNRIKHYNSLIEKIMGAN